ncbi:hypothetical protein [Phenylobacterium sp.]|jgi:hypothetical protein|nr:hypothetical protein [Phenylobacterium sp.]MDP1600186.1 hypothetical protein [Phenylobacterium sp.]MDP3593583.1 hypothetical protein [Phenylobacterium sp.]
MGTDIQRIRKINRHAVIALFVNFAQRVRARADLASGGVATKLQ